VVINDRSLERTDAEGVSAYISQEVQKAGPEWLHTSSCKEITNEQNNSIYFARGNCICCPEPKFGCPSDGIGKPAKQNSVLSCHVVRSHYPYMQEGCR